MKEGAGITPTTNPKSASSSQVAYSGPNWAYRYATLYTMMYLFFRLWLQNI